MTLHRGEALLGCRGPLVDSIAIVAAAALSDDLVIGDVALHFLDLDGLGVRDLTRDGPNVLILAGPVSNATGPFRLYRWRPSIKTGIQRPRCVFEWPYAGSQSSRSTKPRPPEKPEGICRLTGELSSSFLILYDAPDESRVKRSTFTADVMSMS